MLLCMGIEIEKSALNAACRMKHATFMITMFKVCGNDVFLGLQSATNFG